MQIVGSASPVFAQTEGWEGDKITVEVEGFGSQFIVLQEPAQRHR